VETAKGLPWNNPELAESLPFQQQASELELESSYCAATEPAERSLGAIDGRACF